MLTLFPEGDVRVHIYVLVADVASLMIGDELATLSLVLVQRDSSENKKTIALLALNTVDMKSQ